MAATQVGAAVEDAWSTTKKCVEKGADLCVDESAELLSAVDADWCDAITSDQLRAWKREDEGGEQLMR